MSDYIMNPFSKPWFCLILKHYGTSIINVYIGTILEWFGSHCCSIAQYVTHHRHKQTEVAPAKMFFHKMHTVLFINS